MPNTNGSLIWNNFQDQTSTATVITPPKSMYSTGLNAICHMSGNFYEGRSAKFWYVPDAIGKSLEFSHQKVCTIYKEVRVCVFWFGGRLLEITWKLSEPWVFVFKSRIIIGIFLSHTCSVITFRMKIEGYLPQKD